MLKGGKIMFRKRSFTSFSSKLFICIFSTAFHESVSKKLNDLIVLLRCNEVTFPMSTKKILEENILNVRNQINEIVSTVVTIIDDILLPASESKITDLFYYKMLY